jgi:hypothetical protein
LELEKNPVPFLGKEPGTFFLTQNLSSPSPRDRSGVSESIVSQSEVQESNLNQPVVSRESLTANTAPIVTQAQSLRSRLSSAQRSGGDS